MKYVRYILSVFLGVMFFGSISLADGTYTTQEVEDSFLSFVSDTYNMTIPFDGQYGQQNKTRLDEVLNLWISEPENKLITYMDMNNYLYFGVVTSYSISINQVTYNYDIVNSYRPSLGAIVNPGYRGTLTDTFASDSFRDLGTLSEFMNPIDYDNTVFDGTIFAPNFNIQNKLHAGTQNIDLEYVAIADDNIYNTEIEYYTYIKMYLYSAKDVLVDYGKYTVNSYYKSDPIVIFDYSDLHKDNTSLWLDLNDYKTSAEQFMQYVTDYVNLNYVSGMSAGTQLSRTTEFLTNLNKGFPHFVNGVEIWAQNFYIFEGTVYTSNWTKWNSTRYSDYNTVVPVADDQPANGIKNTETPTQVSDQEADTADTYNPIGEQTGESAVNVTINNSTPNYPDYPTVATYNHDNILLQFIQTAKYIPDMFSGYGSFLASAFVFIPSGIWTIIGFGFLGSIAIMIIKVL